MNCPICRRKPTEPTVAVYNDADMTAPPLRVCAHPCAGLLRATEPSVEEKKKKKKVDRRHLSVVK